MNPEGSRPALQVEMRKHVSPAFELHVAFTAPPGFTILFGPSGAGKTTILDCLSGLRAPDEGRVAIGDRVLFDSQNQTWTAIPARRVGYVFQSLALFPHMSVERNIHYGLGGVAEGERRERTAAILQSFGITHLLKKKPGEISGGERQRVALARSLVTAPALLLLDEPLAGIDRRNKENIFAELRRWNADHAIPILYVTHSYREVFNLGERVILLADGKIQAIGAPQEVLGNGAEGWE